MQTRYTVTVQKALSLVDEGVLDETFRKALSDLAATNYAQVDVVVEYGENGDTIAVAQHDGIMVGFFLDPYVGEKIALPGGEDVNSLHITLAYLGLLDSLTIEQQRLLIGIVAELARDNHALTGVTAGLNFFGDGGASEVDTDSDEDDDNDGAVGSVPLYAAVNVPGLFELRAALLARLDEAGIPYDKTHPNFVPHITLAYVDPEDLDGGAALDQWQMTPVRLNLRCLTTAIGGAHFDATLFGDVWDDYAAPESPWQPPSAYRPAIASRMTKAVDVVPEQQLTIGPFYVPEMVDAHGDWIPAADLEPVFHEWMAEYAHEGIRLQHEPAIVAGAVVEGYILRKDTTFEVPRADGSKEEVFFKAGTPMVGTKWNDWAWKLVKNGDITGLSIGGTAIPVEQDLGAGGA